jgi:endonuclease G
MILRRPFDSWRGRSVALGAIFALGGAAAYFARSEAPPSHTMDDLVVDAGAAEDSPQLAMGIPRYTGSPPLAPADDHLMVKREYALSYNHSKNVANWVSWRIDAESYGPMHRYHGNFFADSSLPADWYHVQHEDYTGTDYERGHMVRAEERSGTRQENHATFLLTNVLPQRHDLNTGPWLAFEAECMDLVKEHGRVLHLVAGGTYADPDHPKVLRHGVAIPDAFFKVAVVLEPGQTAADVRPSTRVIAVFMPNETGILDRPWSPYRTTLAEIERQARFTFLTAVPEATRAALKTRVDDGPAEETTGEIALTHPRGKR